MPSRRRPDPEPTVSIFPNQLRIGDRITTDDGDWIVASRPVTYRQGHEVRARVVAALFCALVVVSGCATIPDEQRIDNIPMYGQPAIPRPDFAKRADETFIKEAAAGF